MKCSSIKLINRKEYKRKTIKQQYDKPFVFSNLNVEYSISSSRSNYEQTLNREPILAVTDLKLPDNFRPFNTGSSLEKWAKKKPRLKSAQPNFKDTSSFKIDEYDITFDINDLLNNLNDDDEEEENNNNDNLSTGNLEYEIHSDIEELWQRSQRSEKEKLQDEFKKTKKKIKSKLKKLISKPVSPETEQIIRVDVTSNGNNGKGLINKSDQNNLFDEDVEDDFVIKCKQLEISKKV